MTWKEYIFEYKPFIKAVLKELLSDDEYHLERDDLVSESLLKCLRMKSEVRKSNTALLRVVVESVVKDYRRVRDRRLELETSCRGVEGLSEIALQDRSKGNEIFKDIERCLRRKGLSDIFMLHFREGFTITEIGKMVGLRRETVSRKYQQCLSIIREEIFNEW